MKTDIKYILFISILSLMLFAVGCEQGPQEIRIGEQECDHCRMMISQEQFAAQLVTRQGRQYAFDAIECMAAFRDSRAARDLEIQSLWVPDFNRPENWLEADKAHFLQSDQLRSPMALNFSAYSGQEEARRQQEEFGGRTLGWSEVQSIVRESWSGDRQH